jgi:WD40 repeat protein
VFPVNLTTDFTDDSYYAPAVFTPDSRSIIAIEPDGGLAQWDVVTLQEMHRWRVPGQTTGRVAAIAPDCTQAAIHHTDGTLSFLDLATGVERTNMLKHASHISSCWFSASSRHLVTVMFEGVADYEGQFWDLSSGEIMGTFQGQFIRRWKGSALCMQDIWAIGLIDKVRIWNLNRPHEPPMELFPGTHNAVIGNFDVSPDGRLGAAPYQDGYIRVWNMETPEPVRMLRVHSSNSVTFSPVGHRLASGSGGREAVKLWETTTWQEVLTLAGEGRDFRFVAFSPDGQTLIARDGDGLLHIWSAPSLEIIDKADATSISNSVTPLPTK